MGEPTLPGPFCDNCHTCHPDGETPCQKYISYTAITDCKEGGGIFPPPLNEVIVIDQIVDEACEWDKDFDDYHFHYRSAILAGSFVNQKYFASFFFDSFNAENCKTRFSNNLVCGIGGAFGGGGEAAVMWNGGPADGSVGSLLNSINMEPHEKTKFEFWPASEERIVVRFARKKDATNILILVEPENL